ncbi:heartless-like protein [Leptotrombidium deliense]|uniref:Heartless-like protein n=1 Tax=Leptotrombidium deliense TaxID=299467 RepID=A0A443SWX3_9ACAR|nr:heartless-like protein [Leptotrombidium deliense]
MTLGGTPYPSIIANELFPLLNQGYRMEKPSGCSNELYSLMLSCWRDSPDERPSFKEIVDTLDDILTIATDQEYLNLYAPILDTPPSSFDSLFDRLTQERYVNTSLSKINPSYFWHLAREQQV